MNKTQIESRAEDLAKKVAAQKLKEEKVMVTSPKPYVQRTEKLSNATKQAHDTLYRKYIEDFNKVQLSLQAASRSGDFYQYRSLVQTKTFLLNAIKLHELYFSNISDLSSELSVNSLTYTKLVECFGSFDNWQQDFIACCLTSREGWAITYFDPYLKTYTNCVVDSHDLSIPVGCIPLIVMDMWSHAYFHDYGTDKRAYVYNMMKELNWTVIESRFEALLANNLNSVFALKPMLDAEQPNLVAAPTAVNYDQMPINAIETDKDKTVGFIPHAPDEIFQESINNLGKKINSIVKS